MIPFLPALIYQGREWSFAATTRSGENGGTTTCDAIVGFWVASVSAVLDNREYLILYLAFYVGHE
ncbi:hypothetical protein PG985_005546 [Apiospora marii]|uniref:uncharacterized protein n=1 Tax=Apiospora marii TaxID=335849 RepID=UPI0031303C0C